jgi:hypothetical protein
MKSRLGNILAHVSLYPRPKKVSYVEPDGTNHSDRVAAENPEALFQADRLVPLQRGLVGKDEDDNLAIHWGATSCRLMQIK